MKKRKMTKTLFNRVKMNQVSRGQFIIRVKLWAMKLKILPLFAWAMLSFNLYALEYKTYLFSELSQKMGYPNETYFGSSEDQIANLETYISKEDTFYKEINSYLRYFPAPYDWNGLSPEQAKLMVENIDRIYNKIPALPQDLILFRGVNLKYRHNKSFAMGEEFNELGYLSTSSTFKVATHFATKLNDSSAENKKAILVLYQNRSEHKGILIDQNEDEVLIKHRQPLRVMALKKNNPLYELYLVQICKLSCEQEINKDIERFWNNFKAN